MEEINYMKEVDLFVMAKHVWSKKVLFAKILPIVFIIVCAYVLCIPRYYYTEMELAPEMSKNNLSGGSLGSIAESLGFNLNDMTTNDAINPLLYPKLMSDNLFIYDILSIHVNDKKENINTTYYDYLVNYQKRPWWSNLFSSILHNEDESDHKMPQNPYILNKAQESIYNKAQKDITISIDKRSGVITISAQAQSPYICMSLADSVCKKLQDYITNYRTRKARIDYEYYTKLTLEAQDNYDKVRKKYARYSDANTDITLTSVKVMLDDLENDMQLKFNTYTTFAAQQQNALARIQDKTPAFTVIQGAALPIKPNGPKRMLIVIGWLIFASICICANIIYKSYKLKK